MRAEVDARDGELQVTLGKLTEMEQRLHAKNDQLRESKEYAETLLTRLSEVSIACDTKDSDIQALQTDWATKQQESYASIAKLTAELKEAHSSRQQIQDQFVHFMKEIRNVRNEAQIAL